MKERGNKTNDENLFKKKVRVNIETVYKNLDQFFPHVRWEYARFPEPKVSKSHN